MKNSWLLVTLSSLIILIIYVTTNVKFTLSTSFLEYEDDFAYGELISGSESLEPGLCKPFSTAKVFVETTDHPLSKALTLHPTAVSIASEACIHIIFYTGSPIDNRWKYRSRLVVINLMNDQVYEKSEPNTIVVQSNHGGRFRSSKDYSLFTNVPSFNINGWKNRSMILPLHREVELALLRSSTTLQVTAPGISSILCDKQFCDLSRVKFCLIRSSSYFHLHLLHSLRASCIPVILSINQPLPFQEELDWTLVSFRFPSSSIEFIPEVLETVQKEIILEMRRRGRVYLERFDDAHALAKSLIASISGRLQFSLPQTPEVKANIVKKIESYNQNHTRISSPQLPHIQLPGFLTKEGWISGRDLTYAPRYSSIIPMMPGDAGYYKGTKELIQMSKGQKNNANLGLSRDIEQYTAVILTYNRDGALNNTMKKLNGCKHLNKVVVIWNNLNRTIPETWTQIHVPIEFVLSPKNDLNIRFAAFDNIENEAILSLDDDANFDCNQIEFGFRAWRESRDSSVGFPNRYTYMKNGKSKYGHGQQCEYNLVLTGLTFLHKEYLTEYYHGQHPAILEHTASIFNCEDIGMNYLIAHLSRKSHVYVTTKLGIGQKVKGLSTGGSHYNKRNNCIEIFNRIYGYNPLLSSQMTVHPISDKCVR